MNERNLNRPQDSSLLSSKSLNKSRKGKILTIFLVLLLLLSLSATAFYYYKYQTLKSNPTRVTEAETQRLVDDVGKLIELPTEEYPTIATVENKDKLKDQPFFTNTENGDKILIYTRAKKAIIYRASSNRIINVGPILISTDTEINK